jgi:lipase chaperone LimK
MDKKRILAIVGVVLVVLIGYKLFLSKPEPKKTGYVFDKKSKISISDVKSNLKKMDFNDKKAQDLFTESIINKYTLKYFKFLEKKFYKDTTIEGHFESVKNYLLSIMSKDEAMALFNLYKKYLTTEMNLQKMMKKWGTPKTLEDHIDILHKIQEYRRKALGKNIADILFGPSIKSKEYPIRRSAILNDKNLTAAEKREKLNRLNKDMWGDEADKIEFATRPYQRYNEQKLLYTKDFQSMSAEDKKAKIKEIREKIFTPEQVKRLEQVDKQLEEEKERDSTYSSKKQDILNDMNLDADEKKQKINDLQNELYGKDADALRRREKIQEGLDKLKNKK